MNWRFWKRDKKEPVVNMMDTIGKGLSEGKKEVQCECYGYKSSIKDSKTKKDDETMDRYRRDDDDDIVTDIIIPAMIIDAVLEDAPDTNMSDPTPDNSADTIDSPADSGSTYEASSDSGSSYDFSSSDSGGGGD